MTMLVLGAVVAGLVPLSTVICVCGVVLIRDAERRRDVMAALSILNRRRTPRAVRRHDDEAEIRQ